MKTQQAIGLLSQLGCCCKTSRADCGCNAAAPGPAWSSQRCFSKAADDQSHCSAGRLLCWVHMLPLFMTVSPPKHVPFCLLISHSGMPQQEI